MIVDEVEQEIEKLKESKGIDTVIICGIETHVCILATVIDLIARGLYVDVIADGVSSRTEDDRKMALERIRSMGAFVTTTESAILAMVGDAAHPKFKAVQRVIKDLTPSTNLF